MDVRANGRKSRQQGRKERDRKKSKEKVGVGKIRTNMWKEMHTENENRKSEECK